MGTAGRAGADVLTKLSNPEMAPHTGTRLISISEGPGSPLVLTYRENVSVAGDGTFAIDPGEVIEPQMSPETSDLFDLLQKSREAFFHRSKRVPQLDAKTLKEEISELINELAKKGLFVLCVVSDNASGTCWA